MRILTILFSAAPITMAITMNITLKVQVMELWRKNTQRPCLWNMVVSFILCQLIMIPSVFLDEVALAIRIVSSIFYPVVWKELHLSSATFSLRSSTSKLKRVQAAARRS